MQTRWSDNGLLIRPLRPTDIDAFWEAALESHAEVGRWLPWCHPDYTRAESEAWIMSRPDAWENGEAYSFGIFDIDSRRFLGGCGLNHINTHHNFCSLGYWIRTSATRGGVATTATRLVARFGFKEIGLGRIEIVVDVNNRASLRVAEKVGATREGVLRDRLVLNDRANDAVMFSLVPKDFGLAF